MARPRLPNSPLVDVACEVRFHGSLRILERAGAFQDELRLSFPKLLLPGAAVGTSPLLQHVRFASELDDRFVMLAVNSMAYSTRRYGEFEEFQTDFLQIFGAFQRHFPELKPTRFGLRYQNLLPDFPGPAVPGALHPCLKLRVGNLQVSQPNLISAQCALEFGADWGVLRLVLVPQEDRPRMVLKQPDGSHVVFPAEKSMRLDLDAFRAGDFELGEVPRLLELAHGAVDEAFFNLITDEYLAYLKGASP